MRILGKVVGCAALVILLTGCGREKTLSCKMVGIGDNEGMTQAYDLTFDKKEMLKSGKMKIDYKLEEDMLEYFEAFKSQMKKEFDSDDYKGIDVKFSDNGKDTININFDFDAKEASKAMGEDLTDEDTYDNIKKSLEDDGYTCK